MEFLFIQACSLCLWLPVLMWTNLFSWIFHGLPKKKKKIPWTYNFVRFFNNCEMYAVFKFVGNLILASSEHWNLVLHQMIWFNSMYLFNLIEMCRKKINFIIQCWLSNIAKRKNLNLTVLGFYEEWTHCKGWSYKCVKSMKNNNQLVNNMVVLSVEWSVFWVVLND